jgi:hypothetical protein
MSRCDEAAPRPFDRSLWSRLGYGDHRTYPLQAHHALDNSRPGDQRLLYCNFARPAEQVVEVRRVF